MNFKTSWRNQLWPLRLLRAWLGFTWIYAGWDKASDPGFLTSGSPTFIGTQLSAFATNSPIGFAIDSVLENATQIGIFVALAEFAIGVATLLWIAPTWAAFGGFAMSLILWLASSWHVKPYFLASNSAYTILWLTYFLFLYGSRRKSKISVDRRGFLRVSTVENPAARKLLKAPPSRLGQPIPLYLKLELQQFSFAPKLAYLLTQRSAPIKGAPLHSILPRKNYSAAATAQSLTHLMAQR